MKIKRGSTGKAKKMSTIRITAVSMKPPRSPAVSPRSTPMARTRAVAQMATMRTERAPQIRRERLSAPASLVPSQCADDGLSSEGPETAFGS